MVASWLPLTYAINSINRSMGQPDMYPFVLSPIAVEKLGFVHQVVSGAAKTASGTLPRRDVPSRSLKLAKGYEGDLCTWASDSKRNCNPGPKYSMSRS